MNEKLESEILGMVDTGVNRSVLEEWLLEKAEYTKKEIQQTIKALIRSGEIKARKDPGCSKWLTLRV